MSWEGQGAWLGCSDLVKRTSLELGWGFQRTLWNLYWEIYPLKLGEFREGTP